MAAVPPFDPPNETLAEAVAQQLDFAARLDTLERKADAHSRHLESVVERQNAHGRELVQARADIGRAIDIVSANSLMLERIEGHFISLLASLKKGKS